MTNEQLVYNKDYDTLIKANNRYLMKVAQSMNQDDHYEDLLQAGRIGLFYASQNYNPAKGVPFIKYAGWWVRKEMLRYLTYNSRTIRLPQNVQLAAAKGDFDVMTNTISTNYQINENQTIEDLIANEPILSDLSNEHPWFDRLPYLLKKLSEIESKVLKMYYGLNIDKKMTLQEIGDEMGLTRERIRQIHSKAIKKLQTIVKNK